MAACREAVDTRAVRGMGCSSVPHCWSGGTGWSAEGVAAWLSRPPLRLTGSWRAVLFCACGVGLSQRAMHKGKVLAVVGDG